jgi:uncharacterized protein
VKALKKSASFLTSVLLKSLLLLVRSYQLFLSPILGSHCRFYPSCSHYCQEALQEHGLKSGLILSIKRIFRCHPGTPGGFDPVPKKS